MDILKALKSFLKHRRKHVLRLLQLYGDQAYGWGSLIIHDYAENGGPGEALTFM